MRLRFVLLLALLCSHAFASPLSPTVVNGGFESVEPGNDAPGWEWYARSNVLASFRSGTVSPHSGTRCMTFTNGSGMASEVYGRLYQQVPVLPATTYEVSAWVRGQDVSDGLHFTDWNCYTLPIPSGSYGWRRISTTFETAAGQTNLNLGVNVVNKCKLLAIDDLSIRPVGTPFRANGISGIVLAPREVMGDDKESTLAIHAVSTLPRPVDVKATIDAGSERLLEVAGVLKPGDSSLDWRWSSGRTTETHLVARITITDRGRTLSQVTCRMEKTSARTTGLALDRAEARLAELDALLSRCRAKGIPVDYPTVTRTMLEQFIPLARRDLEIGEEQRAAYAARDFERSANAAIADMKSWLKDPALAPVARRFQTGPVKIEGLSLIASTKDSSGRTGSGPVFLCGYGHFRRVYDDMPRWPEYGVNIVQAGEFGPAQLFPSENEVSMQPVEYLISILDEAARRNVRVDFLISQHYFPEWALKKWPHLSMGGGGFLGFTPDAAEAKAITERYLRIVIPLIKDKPALNSICLSNEPMLTKGASSDNTAPMWADYLSRVHGDVATMNRRYGTNYASFAEVPAPDNSAYDAPQFYDWCVFNQERFASWHSWMAEIIHEMAPGVPVHAKVMSAPVHSRTAVTYGTDPELFGRFSQFNGNDCQEFPGDRYWAISWSQMGEWYDLQRSVARKPIFNSENHIQMDRYTAYVPPAHYRTALWQGAIHGQGATTIWVWERAPEGNHTSDFCGNVMDRPGCAEAVGLTCLDLNRFPGEVTALQNAKAPVALLYSVASCARDDGYLSRFSDAYSALNFCGVKVDMITERQLAAGKGSEYKMIVLPGARSIPDSSFAALLGLPKSTRLVTVGEVGAVDPYGRTRSAESISALRSRSLALPAADPESVLWPRLRSELGRLGALPSVAVVDAKTGKPVWGIEWLSAKVGGRTVVNMVQLRTLPADVCVKVNGKTVPARDLLSPGGRSQVRRLTPITPVLAVIDGG